MIKRLFFLALITATFPLLAQNKMQRTIESAFNFINCSTENKSYNLQILYVWLSKQYSFENKVKLSYNFYEPLNQDDNVSFNFYRKLIQEDILFGKDSLISYYHKTYDIERLMLWSLNTEHLEFDSICKSVLENYSSPNSNIRQVAHVALAYYWAKNVSKEIDISFFKSKIKDLTDNLLFGIENEPSVNDNFLEGIIGLICLDHSNMIKKKWLRKIINAQNSDGGWAWEPIDNKTSNLHTTIIAIWILLETSK